MSKNKKENLAKNKQVVFGTKKARLLTFGATSLAGLAIISVPVTFVITNDKGGRDSTTKPTDVKPHQDMDEPIFLIQYPGSIANHGIVANAFKDTTLPADFALPSTITDIGNFAFSNATLPAGFTIPSSVTSIGYSAFEHANLPIDFIIPSTVASIDATAFSLSAIPTGCN